jgi:hypothetical protein
MLCDRTFVDAAQACDNLPNFHFGVIVNYFNITLYMEPNGQQDQHSFFDKTVVVFFLFDS